MKALYFRWMIWGEKLKESWEDETGASVIEVAVIIIILVGIAIIFKGNLQDFLEEIIGKMNASISDL